VDKGSIEKIKILRYETKASLLDCKNAFIESEGNMEEAIKKLRRSGILKGMKKSIRKTSEGLIVLNINKDNSVGVLLEVNCETDFVTRNEDFINYVKFLSELSVLNNLKNIESLSVYKGENELSVENMRLELVSKYGENIRIERIKYFEGIPGSVFGYVHGKGSLGSILSIKGKDYKLARDIAMHITAMNPMYLSRNLVPNDIVDEKKEIYLSETLKDCPNKDKTIITKIVDGKLEKDLNNIVLLNQIFVKTNKSKVSDIINGKIEIIDFIRFDVGKEI